MSLDDDVRAELSDLEAAHRLRLPCVVDGAQGVRITLDGLEVLSFASNDYLGLAGDRRLAHAAANALADGGAGAGASRLIVGNHRHHVQLELALADWLRVPAARVFNSGYAANIGVLTSLAREGDVIFSDELNHASIIDGCRLSRARIVVYSHRDMGALERELASRPGRRRLVVSETLFSMDGDIAELDVLEGLCRRHDAGLILDEAHAIGVWGIEGRGLAAHAGIQPDVLIGTCGKALGAFGAFAATTSAIADLLWNRARSFVFSTALPPSVAAMVHAAVEIVRSSEGDALRCNLVARAIQLRNALTHQRRAEHNAGIHPCRRSVGPRPAPGDDRAVEERDTGVQASAACSGAHPTLSRPGLMSRGAETTTLQSEMSGPSTAIVPIMVGDDRKVMELSSRLLESRVFVQGIRPPTVPPHTARLRVTVSAAHSTADIEVLSNALLMLGTMQHLRVPVSSSDNAASASPAANHDYVASAAPNSDGDGVVPSSHPGPLTR